MKIQFCSDLHLEFLENRKWIMENPIIPKGEILILEGDIVLLTEIHHHQTFFDYVSDHFEQTFWIPGNTNTTIQKFPKEVVLLKKK